MGTMELNAGGGFIVDEEHDHDGHLGNTACCEHCGSLSYSNEWYNVFKVMVCSGCRALDKYRLIAKGAAKSNFMLTDGDLKKLGCLTKPNPQHPNWADMKLYLQCQVQELALKKHGSMSAINDMKKQRLETRIAGRLDGNRSRSIQQAPAAQHDETVQHDSGDEDQGTETQPLNAAQQRVKMRLVQQYGSWEGQATHQASTSAQPRQAVSGSVKRRRVAQGTQAQPPTAGVDDGPGVGGIEVEDI